MMCNSWKSLQRHVLCHKLRCKKCQKVFKNQICLRRHVLCHKIGAYPDDHDNCDEGSNCRLQHTAVQTILDYSTVPGQSNNASFEEKVDMKETGVKLKEESKSSANHHEMQAGEEPDALPDTISPVSEHAEALENFSSMTRTSRSIDFSLFQSDGKGIRNIIGKPDLPFKCVDCKSRFSTLTATTSHFIRCHSYICKPCNKYLPTKLTLDRHEMTIHAPQDRFKYKCDKCGKAIKYKKTFLTHTCDNI